MNITARIGMSQLLFLQKNNSGNFILFELTVTYRQFEILNIEIKNLELSGYKYSATAPYSHLVNIPTSL